MADLRTLRGRGTLLNTLTVLIGALLGLSLRQVIRADLVVVVTTGLGLVTLVLALKMALEGKRVLALAFAIALGGLIGKGVGLDQMVESGAEWARTSLGQSGSFSEGLIASSLLFCVGPLTLLGCMEDALERKIDLLSVKSLLDGITSVFFAAAMGAGVVLTALVVLVVQGALTLCASRLKGISEDRELLSELSAAGGCILLLVGAGMVGLTDSSKVPSAIVFLPALCIVPLAIAIEKRLVKPIQAP